MQLKRIIDSRKPRPNIEAYSAIRYIKRDIGMVEVEEKEPEGIFSAIQLVPVKKNKTNEKATRTVGNTTTNIVSAHEIQLLYSEGAIDEAFSFKR